jgi:acetylornithine deacetylase/succinyl-diaminopimelate desuccinylase-like protein
VRTDDTGNVTGMRQGTSANAAPIVVCAHLDTVFPHGTELRVHREGSRLIAPGIGDNARGLAVMLALAGAIDGRAVRTTRPVVFAATVGEEGLGDLRGAKQLFAAADRDGRRPHAAIALDGPGDDRVVHQALGSRRYRVRFAGPGGHSWAAFGVPNAVHAAGAAVAALARLPLTASPRTTLTVGRIGGGLSVNTIPADAWFEIDVRSLDAHALAALEHAIRTAVAAATAEENARRTPGTAPLTEMIETIGDRPAGVLDERHPLVLAACESTRLVGREPQLAIASTDANVPIALGIPAVAIGAGGEGGEAHTEAEWFSNRDGARGVARALTLVTAAAR